MHHWVTVRSANPRRKSAMSMQTKLREVNDVIVIDLSGRITLGEGSVSLRDQIQDVLTKENKQILLNLGGVSYIDSSGLGELISAHTSAKNRGREVKLLNLTKKVRDLMEIVKLSTVFDIFDEEASAIASFQHRDRSSEPEAKPDLGYFSHAD
jgi:anti-sigma B factor antagonist